MWAILRKILAGARVAVKRYGAFHIFSKTAHFHPPNYKQAQTLFLGR